MPINSFSKFLIKCCSHIIIIIKPKSLIDRWLSEPSRLFSTSRFKCHFTLLKTSVRCEQTFFFPLCSPDTINIRVYKNKTREREISDVFLIILANNNDFLFVRGIQRRLEAGDSSTNINTLDVTGDQGENDYLPDGLERTMAPVECKKSACWLLVQRWAVITKGRGERNVTLQEPVWGKAESLRFCCVSDSERLRCELLFSSYANLMASPGMSTASSNLFIFSVNSDSVKEICHYLIFKLSLRGFSWVFFPGR